MGVEDHGSALVTTVNFARTQADTMDRFVRAFVEAIALGKRDKNLAKKVYAKYLRLTDDNLLELNYKVYLLGSIPKIPTFPVDALKNVISDLAEENPPNHSSGGGLKPPRPSSTAAAKSNNLSSPLQGPTIWTPTGMPAAVWPA